ncbi:MAG TPA: hypothetical protein VKV38_06910 [Trebonia sp.]|nr:hypothetical protein [Trebonia sp.]
MPDIRREVPDAAYGGIGEAVGKIDTVVAVRIGDGLVARAPRRARSREAGAYAARGRPAPPPRAAGPEPWRPAGGRCCRRFPSAFPPAQAASTSGEVAS